MKDKFKKAKHAGLHFVAMLTVLSIILPIIGQPIVALAADGEQDLTLLDSDSGIIAESPPDIIPLGASEVIPTLEISNEAELIAFATRVNRGDPMAEEIVALTADILLETTPWIPIGNAAASPFSGTFLGNGHSITNIVIDGETKGGLFGFLSNATIKNVAIFKANAPNSTAGLFYSAVSSTVELSTYEENGKIELFSLTSKTRRNFGPMWQGTTSDSWRGGQGAPLPTGIYEINTAEELADLAVFHDSWDSAWGAGSTFVLMNDLNLGGAEWIPIGSETPFQGHFVGNDHVIKNLKVGNETTPEALDGGLFTNTIGYDPNGDSQFLSSSIDGIIIENATVYSDGGAGALAGVLVDTDVSNVVVKNSTIHGDGSVGGVVGSFVSQDTYTSLNNNIVHDVKITGAISAGGIVGDASAASIRKNIVSTSTISAPDSGTYAGGIAGDASYPPDHVMTFSENLVLGVTFIDSESIFGIASSTIGLDGLALSNNVVSGLKVTNGSGLTSKVYLGGATNLQSAQYNFTDSFLEVGRTDIDSYDFIDSNVSGADLIINNNTWDSNVDGKATTFYPKDNSNPYGNASYSTAYLTNGVWAPNANWVAKETYYPQLRGFAEVESTNPTSEFINTASGLAASAIVPVYNGDIYSNNLPGARGIRLSKNTPNGKTITWSVTGTDIVEDNSHPDYTQYDTNSSSTLTIVASVETSFGTIQKYFDNVYIIDGVLREDKTARIDHGFTQANPPLLKIEQVAPRVYEPIQLTYLEDVEANADVIGNAELYVLRSDNAYHLIQSIPVDKTEADVFTISSSKRVARVHFSLVPGNKYKAVFPVGFVVEMGKGNASEKADLFFETDLIGTPEIVDTNPSIVGNSKTAMTMQEVVNGITVYRNSNRFETLYDAAVDGVPKRYSGSWNNENPTISAKNAAKSLPDGEDSVRYYFEHEKKVIKNNPQAGNYLVYILVKNKEGRSTYQVVNILIEGNPEWSNGIAPKPVVHIPLTKNIDTVKSAAKQGTSAVVLMNDDFYIPVPLRIEVPQVEWERIESNPESTAYIDVTITPLTQSGAPSDIGCTVRVYLDKHLAYTMTPSPVVMHYTTPSQIEKFINFRTINFPNNQVEYDHWEENYRKPGLYHIEVYTEQQDVTLCGDKNCKYENHPQESVHEFFDVQIIEPLGPEIESYWGEVSRQIEDSSYSQESVQVKPSNYMLPNYVLNLLEKQDAGKLQLNYFDEYRWNIYSSTLNPTEERGDVYSLHINPATNKNVDKLVENKEGTMQFVFEQQGKLFGTAEFEINLKKVQEKYPDLPSKNLGLYYYVPQSNELALVSEMIVDSEGKWASAVIDEIAPTTYVVKSMGGIEEESKIRNDVEVFTIKTRSKEYQEGFITNTGLIEDNSSNTFLGSSVIDTSDIHVNEIARNILVPVMIALFVVIASAGFICYRKLGRKGDK